MFYSKTGKNCPPKDLSPYCKRFNSFGHPINMVNANNVVYEFITYCHLAKIIVDLSVRMCFNPQLKNINFKKLHNEK